MGDNPTGDNPCGDEHFFNVPENNQCAWQEGFPDFLPVAINDDLNFDWPGGGFQNMEILPAEYYENMSPTDALRTEGAVARALYDLYDAQNDFPAAWQVGRDVYSGGLTRIFDVLRNTNQHTFSTYWSHWGVPRHLPVQAIRLNGIDFNTVPVWQPIGNAWLYPNQVYNLNVYGQIADTQSSDADLILSVVSNSNPLATLSWPTPGQLRATFPPNTEGGTYIVLAASDGLAQTNSNTFHVVWSNTNPGGGYQPPLPCEYPCPAPKPALLPAVSDLQPPRPNPFNPQTTIAYDLAAPDEIRLRIYDVRGELVRALVNGFQQRGRYTVIWDGKNDDGLNQASGLYFAVMETTRQRFTQKLVLLK